MLRRFFGPSQSLILLYDHLAGETVYELREQLEEVGRYYRFHKISDIAGPHRRRNLTGAAAVAFCNARKSVLLHAVPFLIGEEIPFSLFLRTDCIGLNRLPLEEELAAYREHYPEKLSEAESSRLVELCWNDPATVDAFLREARGTIGPLPLEKLDPTRFFATWGKILEAPPTLRELGLHLTTSPANRLVTEEAIAFFRKQTGGAPRVAWAPRAVGDAAGTLGPLGIEVLVTPRQGAVDPTTDRYALPVWPLEKRASHDRG